MEELQLTQKVLVNALREWPVSDRVQVANLVVKLSKIISTVKSEGLKVKMLLDFSEKFTRSLSDQVLRNDRVKIFVEINNQLTQLIRDSARMEVTDSALLTLVDMKVVVAETLQENSEDESVTETLLALNAKLMDAVKESSSEDRMQQLLNIYETLSGIMPTIPGTVLPRLAQVNVVLADLMLSTSCNMDLLDRMTLDSLQMNKTIAESLVEVKSTEVAPTEEGSIVVDHHSLLLLREITRLLGLSPTVITTIEAWRKMGKILHLVGVLLESVGKVRQTVTLEMISVMADFLKCLIPRKISLPQDEEVSPHKKEAGLEAGVTDQRLSLEASVTPVVGGIADVRSSEEIKEEETPISDEATKTNVAKMMMAPNEKSPKLSMNVAHDSTVFEGPVKGGDQAPTVDQMKSLDAALLASGEDLSGNSITISKLDANSEADAESSTHGLVVEATAEVPKMPASVFINPLIARELKLSKEQVDNHVANVIAEGRKPKPIRLSKGPSVTVGISKTKLVKGKASSSTRVNTEHENQPAASGTSGLGESIRDSIPDSKETRKEGGRNSTEAVINEEGELKTTSSVGSQDRKSSAVPVKKVSVKDLRPKKRSERVRPASPLPVVEHVPGTLPNFVAAILP